MSHRMLWTVRASTAVFGLALALSIAPALETRARPDDPLSALKLEGYSPGGSILQFFAVVLFTALFAILGVRVARLLSGHRWAEVAYVAAVLLAPVTLMFYGNWRHVALLGLAAAAIVVIRRRDPRFGIEDAILVPAYLSCCIAFLDLGFGRTPVAMATRAAVAIFALRVIARTSSAFLATPLALLAQLGWLRAPVAGWVALAFLAGPAIVAAVLEKRGRRLEVPPDAVRLRRVLVYPLLVFLYPLAVVETSPPYVINVFEDSHSIPVATEMLRGERPYADIVPTHGLISDGLVDAIGLAVGHGSLRTLMEIRLVAGVVSAVAIYCLILAATGVAEIALLGTFLAFVLSSGSTLWLRPSFALFALAAVVAATRLRSRRWFTLAGALVVLAWLTSTDFGLYSAVVTLFAAIRSRAVRAVAIGFLAAAVPVLGLFALFGFALDFFRATGELLGNHGVYFLRPLTVPDCLRSPALLHHLPGEHCLFDFVWIVALVATSAALARSPFRARRTDGTWMIGVWIVVAAASFVERGNYHFFPAVTPFIVAGLWSLARRARTAAAILTAAVILLAQPFLHVITVIPQVRAAKRPPLFDPVSAASARAARKFAATLKAGETFVDFSNSALVYSLTGRGCPLRHVEVANYQSLDGQREVIERIEKNPAIRAVLIAFPGSNAAVDGVPNADRAPLVWRYLQSHFTPAFDEEGVVFWRRVR